MDDKDLIRLYFARSEDAIAETDKKYRRLCMGISSNILSDISDAEECVNDTYMAVWNSVPPQRPVNFRAFLCRIVKNISLKRYEHSHAAKRNAGAVLSIDELTDVLPDSFDVEKLSESKEVSAKIGDFLYSEKQVNRVIFVRRYWFFDSTPQIAERVGMTEGAVKSVLARMRTRLKKYLIKEGIFDEE